MKKILISAILACAAVGAMAQDYTSYFMPDAIERRSLNAAFTPDRGYFAIPIVGSMSLGVTGNISVGDLVKQNTNGDLVTLLDGSISSAQALGSLNKGANYIGLENRINILSMGGYKEGTKGFWSFELGMRTYMNMSMPYELFEFAKLGTSNDMGGISIYAENFMEAAFGYAWAINDKINVGARVKFLMGMANAKLEISKFDVSMNLEEWKVDAAGELSVYAPGASISGDDISAGDEFEMGDVEMGSFGPAGYGAAIDLGVEYNPIENLYVSLSANDIGFIAWGKNNNVTGSVASSQSFQGVDVDLDGNTSNAVDFDLDEINFVSAESKATTRFLQANINLGAEYRLLDDKLGVGAVYSARFWASETIHNVVPSVYFRPVNWFTLAMSYALTNNQSNSLGFAANFSPTWINFYIATNVLTSEKTAQYIPIDQTMMNLSLGIAIPLGKRKELSKE